MSEHVSTMSFGIRGCEVASRVVPSTREMASVAAVLLAGGMRRGDVEEYVGRLRRMRPILGKRNRTESDVISP